MAGYKLTGGEIYSIRKSGMITYNLKGNGDYSEGVSTSFENEAVDRVYNHLWYYMPQEDKYEIMTDLFGQRPTDEEFDEYHDKFLWQYAEIIVEEAVVEGTVERYGLTIEASDNVNKSTRTVRKSAKPLLDIYDDADGELHVIFADGPRFGIGYGYNPEMEPGNSTWRHGSYDFRTYEDALDELRRNKGIVRNVSSRYPQFISKSQMLKNIPSSGAIYRNFPTNESRQTYQIPTWMQNAISKNVIPKRGKMEGLMKNKYSGTKDRKLKKNMSMTKSKKFYFAYGTDPIFPYEGGWTEIHADTYEEAADKHAKVFGTLDFGFGRFAEGFTEEMWQKGSMKDKGNFGAFCHHTIN